MHQLHKTPFQQFNHKMSLSRDSSQIVLPKILTDRRIVKIDSKINIQTSDAIMQTKQNADIDSIDATPTTLEENIDDH